MAAPTRGMDIKAKAVFQLTYKNETSCDAETIALLVAWLNEYYRDQSVHFALLGEPDQDLEGFPVPQVDDTFLFHEHEGFWSVAYVRRRPYHVLMYDGTSEYPSDRLHEDEARMLRLWHLRRAVEGELARLDIPGKVYMSEDEIASHASKPHSAIGCLAWAEAKFRGWSIGHNWDGFEHTRWIPSTGSCSEFAEKRRTARSSGGRYCVCGRTGQRGVVSGGLRERAKYSSGTRSAYCVQRAGGD